LDRINDADVTRGVDETVVRLFSEPLVAAKPVSPKKKLTLAIAGVFGTGVGLAVVLGIGLLDRTLNSRKQIESTLGLAVLAEVPKAFNREWELQDSLFVNRDPHSIVSESFRSLRTSLSAYRARSVMITSAGPEEGKSFCAANLAVLQANLGYRTLLVDADFCRPKMAEIFIDPMHGSIGEGALTTQNLCQPTSFQNLFLITCGRFTSESGAPMSEQVFARMLRESYASFDCVIIDSSPLNMVSDGLNLAPHVDATVLVIKAGQTVVESARLAMHELQRMRARLAGCILNGSSNVSQAQVAYVSEATRMLPERAPDLAGAQY
ncbi:MAG: P-loop NTPase, partial [Verrucomicrobiota bacterium]